MEYLHNQQPSVGHRDIKPANILVVERGVDSIYVKFADFGLSKAADTLKTFCGTLEWAAPEIYLKAADRKGTANDTYSVAVDIWSLGVVIASLECDGLPKYEAAWATDAVAWIHTLQAHVIDHYNQQRSELLWLLLYNMLVEDPDERSSADYCHDEALKLLKLITDTRRQESTASDTESRGGDDGSTTPKPSTPGSNSAMGSESSEEASTFRLDIQPDSQNGSEAQVRETVEDIDESLIANCNTIHTTDSEEEWKRSGAPDLTSVDPQQESMVDGLLWNPGVASPTNNHDEAAESGVGEAKTKAPSEEQDSISFLARYHLGDVQGDKVQAAVETWVARELYQSGRKRPADTRQLSGTAAQQRAINRDGPVHKKPNTGDSAYGVAWISRIVP